METYMWKSELEQLVDNDMIARGYNPTSQDSIKKYWEMMLNGN